MKIKALAITLQVNQKDLECLVTSVFNAMVDDGLGEYYIIHPLLIYIAYYICVIKYILLWLVC